MQRFLFTAVRILLVILVATYPQFAAAQSRVLYVSPLGSDSNSGSSTSPFRTIQRAANVVYPGDTVIVEDGTYTGTGSTSCAVRTIVCMTRGGTATARVTFRARHPGGAKLDGQNNVYTDGFYFKSAASYVTLEGFEIFGVGIPSYATSGGAHGVMIDVAHDIVLSRMHIHHIGRTCTDSSNGMSGVFVRVPKVTITRSVFHDIGRYIKGENGCTLTGSTSRDHGIYLNGSYYSSSTPGASDVLISNNIFYKHERGWAVQLYPGTLTRISIMNNTFAFKNPYLTGHIVIAANTVDSQIKNNIFFQPYNAAVRYTSGTQTNLRLRNNLVYGATLLSSTPSGTTVSSTFYTNPLMVDTTLSPYDFQLVGSSPAIGVGVTLPEVPIDIDGVTRPVGEFDLGAYQLWRP